MTYICPFIFTFMAYIPPYFSVNGMMILCIATSAARYLMSKILTIITTINNQSLLKLPVKAIAENIAQQKFCGKLNLP